MKKLFITRHARTEDTAAEDTRRALSETGITDTREVAKKLIDKGVKIQKIYTSGIRRAEATAQIMAETLHFPHAEVETMKEDYHSSPEDFLTFVQNMPDEYSMVMIVNHNSPLTHFVELLTNQTVEMIHPSCIAQVVFEAAKWSDIAAGSGRLEGIEHPSFDHY